MNFGGVENKIFDHAVFICRYVRLVAVVNPSIFFSFHRYVIAKDGPGNKGGEGVYRRVQLVLKDKFY